MSTREDFAGLHIAGAPLILFNIWDAGSAVAVERVGAQAVATGSHSVAGAHGYGDGEELPLDILLTTVREIAGAVECPLTVDFEAGFAEDLQSLAANARALIEAGAVGCNFEDQLIGQDALRDTKEQADRISVMDQAGLFVNARTDTFLNPLKQGDDPNTIELVEAVVDRGLAYKAAGASSYFIPGLSSPDLIRKVCEVVDLPINVMRMPDMISNAELAGLGVARISYGPAPWRDAMAFVETAARDALAG